MAKANGKPGGGEALPEGAEASEGYALVRSRPPRRPPDWHRAQIMKAVCRRVLDGEPLETILFTAGMPERARFEGWMADNPDLKSIFKAAEETRRRLAQPLQRLHYTPDLGAKVCEALCDAQGLDIVCAQPGMPTQGAVYRWLRDIPDFAEAMGRARQVQADRLFEQIWRIAREAWEDNWRSSKLQIDTLKWLVVKLAPDRYGPPVPGRGEDEEDEPWNVRILSFAETREVLAERSGAGDGSSVGPR
jgi:hypothetical protein